MAAPPPRKRPLRGPTNDLHTAASFGSTERALALLASGEFDVDQPNPNGNTPLMLGSCFGHLPVVRVLLSKGANVSLVDIDDFTALHLSAYQGNPKVMKLLVKAGSELEAKVSCSGCTPLHLAAENGHSEGMRVLIEAGANANSRALDGATPLYMAAEGGHAALVKGLLRARANPLLGSTHPVGGSFLPLDVAAKEGHSEVARELLRQLGIKGCGGTTDGVQALQLAAQRQHVEIMDMLTCAGVVDPGVALLSAAMCGRELSVKFLLHQQGWKTSGREAAYLDILNRFGATPLVCSIEACCFSPRIARLLVDAGADSATAVRLTDVRGAVRFNGTPLAYTNFILREKKIKEKDATEKQLHSLEAIRRQLMRVEAVHAVSWQWARDAHAVTHAAAPEDASNIATTSTPLASMLPILRRRAGRPRVLLAAMFR